MLNRWKDYFAIAFILSASVVPEAIAHGGRLNSSGCHNQRSNGTYHCHRSNGYRSNRSNTYRRTRESHSPSSAASTYRGNPWEHFLPGERVTRGDNDIINSFTDVFWYQVRPEMRGSTILTHKSLYKYEWMAINQVVKTHIAGDSRGCGLFFVGSFDDIADAVFFARYPERAGRKLNASETSLIREWNAIRARIYDPTPEGC